MALRKISTEEYSVLFSQLQQEYALHLQKEVKNKHLTEVLKMHEIPRNNLPKSEMLNRLVGTKIFDPFRSTLECPAGNASMTDHEVEADLLALGWLEGEVTEIDRLGAPEDSGVHANEQIGAGLESSRGKGSTNDADQLTPITGAEPLRCREDATETGMILFTPGGQPQSSTKKRKAMC